MPESQHRKLALAGLAAIMFTDLNSSFEFRVSSFEFLVSNL